MTDPTPALGDGQLATILATVVTVAGILGQAIRWGVKRITKSIDENTASNNADADAKIRLAEEMRELSILIRGISAFVEEHTPPPQEPPKPPRKTPPLGTGYSYVRPKTEGPGR